MTRIPIAFLALVVSCAAPAFAGPLGPSTFDECILANMKGIGSDVAARAVAAACAKQFPAKPASVPAASQPATATPEPRASGFTGFVPDRAK